MNFKTNTIYRGDNLEIMAGFDSKTIDLIYLDPPFNSKRNYEAPVGSVGKKASFKDVWSWDDADKTWLGELSIYNPDLANLIVTCGKTTRSKGNASYLLFMAVRLLACRRLLKDTGSIYLHVDPTMSHYLKAVMDAIFDERNFRNEIIWHYKGTGRAGKRFSSKHDNILFYSKTDKNIFNPIKVPSVKKSGWTGKNEKNCDSVWEINTVFQSAERNAMGGVSHPKALASFRKNYKSLF